MTIDQDRGAYAPHMDAPLAFDARRPSDRRPLPMTLIASAGVLVLIVGALGMAYRGGVRGSEAPKLVGEPVGAIKTAAAPEAASDAAVDSKMDVYAAQNVPSQAPSFAPPPEQPRVRPAPAAVVSAPTSATTTASATPVVPAPSGLQVRTVDPMKVRIGEPETTAAPVLTAADRQAAATSRTAIVAGAADRAPLPVDKAAAVKDTKLTASTDAPTTSRVLASRARQAAATDASAPTAVRVARARPADDRPTISTRAISPSSAPTTTPARSAKDVSARSPETSVAKVSASPSVKPGAAAVQVGAFSSSELAQKGFADAGKLSGLGGHARSVEKISRDGKTFYRATLGGFSDKAAAKAFCAQLTAKGGRCLVKS